MNKEQNALNKEAREKINQLRSEIDLMISLERKLKCMESAIGANMEDRSRNRILVEKRQAIIFILVSMEYRISSVARITGYTHSTVIYAHRKVMDSLSINDKQTNNLVEKCLNALNPKD